MKTSILALVPALCLAAACGDDPAPGVDAGPDASTAPTLAVTVTPTTVPAGSQVTLAVALENFEIVDPRSMTGVMPGKGHYHYQIDTAATYTAAWTPSVTFTVAAATPPGAHAIEVWLVNDSHVDIEPPVYETVTIMVE